MQSVSLSKVDLGAEIGEKTRIDITVDSLSSQAQMGLVSYRYPGWHSSYGRLITLDGRNVNDFSLTFLRQIQIPIHPLESEITLPQV